MLISYFNNNMDDRNYLIKLCLVFITSTYISVILSNQYFIFEYNFVVDCYLKLVCLIFEKILQDFSPANQNNSSEGEIINFALIDSNNLSKAIKDIPYILIYPIEIIFYCVVLFRLLGESFLVEIIPFIIYSIINYYLYRGFALIMDNYLTKKDERIEKTSEILDKLKLLKMYAWENELKNKVGK